jgi:hypothetical protein
VGDDTRKLVEPLLLTTKLSFPFDAVGGVPGDSHETGHVAVSEHRCEVRLPDACLLIDFYLFLVRDRLTSFDTPVIVCFEFCSRLLTKHVSRRFSPDLFGRDSGLTLVCRTEPVELERNVVV